MPKPRHLAFGILAGVIDGDPARLVERQLARGSGANSSGAPCAFRPGQRGSGARSNTARDLGQHACLQHGVEARSRCASRSQARSGASSTVAKRQGAGSPSLCLPDAERPAGRLTRLPRRGHGAGDRRASAAPRSPDPSRRAARGRPRRPSPASRHWPARAAPAGDVGNGGDALHQGPQIKARAAAQDGRAALGQAALDLGRRPASASARPTGSR